MVFATASLNWSIVLTCISLHPSAGLPATSYDRYISVLDGAEPYRLRDAHHFGLWVPHAALVTKGHTCVFRHSAC